jgi:GAF domain-containing protein
VILEGRVIGVLDLDSPLKRRFDESDARALEQAVEVFIASTEFGG